MSEKNWPLLFVSFQRCGSDGRKTINYDVIPFPQLIATSADLEIITGVIEKKVGAYGGDIMILNWRRMEQETQP